MANDFAVYFAIDLPRYCLSSTSQNDHVQRVVSSFTCHALYNNTTNLVGVSVALDTENIVPCIHGILFAFVLVVINYVMRFLPFT